MRVKNTNVFDVYLLVCLLLWETKSTATSDHLYFDNC